MLSTSVSEPLPVVTAAGAVVPGPGSAVLSVAVKLAGPALNSVALWLVFAPL